MNPDTYFASRSFRNAESPGAQHRDLEPCEAVPGGGQDPHLPQTARNADLRWKPFRAPPYATCHKCADSRTGDLPMAARKRSPSGRSEKTHLALFASMCAIGAVAIIDTGPPPLSHVLAAAVALLPPALVIKRRAFGKAARKT